MIEIRTTPHADLQILEIDAWWTANREKAPALFLEELEAGFELISRQPQSGKRYTHPRVVSRRVLLRKTKFHIYYVPYEDHVLVVAVWSGIRGRGPDLGKIPY
jgi:plasmid stabilization system protein ParE